MIRLSVIVPLIATVVYVGCARAQGGDHRLVDHIATVPLAGAAIFLIETGGGLMVDALRSALIVLGLTAILSVFGAVLTTIGWLFRSRAPTLAAIERRLAALETILLSREQ